MVKYCSLGVREIYIQVKYRLSWFRTISSKVLEARRDQRSSGPPLF